MRAGRDPRQNPRQEARAIFDAAVAAVSPAGFLPSRLPSPPAAGRLIVLSAGKAGGSMAAAAEHHYLETLGFPPARFTGFSVARHGYGCQMRVTEQRHSGHPVPDQAGIDATLRMLALAQEAGAGDLVVFLISGGASANLIAPAGSITLAEKQALTKALLRSGAAIDEINIVRKHLSRIKGGRLARLVAPAELVTVALSDVPGDDLSAIGSGPTIPDPSTLADARALIARYAITLPESIRSVLSDPASETPKPGDPAFAKALAIVAARPIDALGAAIRQAEALGYRVEVLGAEIQGEARDIGREHARIAIERAKSGTRLALISGGELTVTIAGNGRGGPSQEYALAFALAVGGQAGRNITLLAADTDGTDGGVGNPDDPAGAFVDAGTLGRAAALGQDAGACLADNDSGGFFARLGDLLQIGPTRTNANDLRVILIND